VTGEVADVVRTYLRLADQEGVRPTRRAPGLIRGLYLVGSVALGEFRPWTGDVDVLAVTAVPPDAPASAALARVPARLRAHRKRPTFDGRYVTWADRRADPALAGAGPTAYEGRFAVRPGPDRLAHARAVRRRLPGTRSGWACGPTRSAAPVGAGILGDYWGRLRRAGDRLAGPAGWCRARRTRWSGVSPA
jgi:hypothetical protein